MKRLLTLFALLFAPAVFAPAIFAQSIGPFALTANSQCTNFIGTDARATVGVYVSGTFSATLQPKATIQGQASFNVQVAPSTSTTLQSTITGTGAFVGAVAGYSSFQVCVSAYTSGTATVWLQSSESQLGSTIGSGSSYVPPVTTKGDVFTFSTVPARLGAGSNGQCLTAQSGQTTGLLWAPCSASPFTGVVALSPAGSLGASSLYWAADGVGQGFFNTGGANEVKEWGDNGGLGSPIWGWTGQGNTDFGVFAWGNGYVGIAGDDGVCTACWTQPNGTTHLRAGTTAARTPIPVEASEYLLIDAPCVSTGGTCGTAAHGWVTIAAAATTVTVSTSAAHINNSCTAGSVCSHIHVQEDSTKSGQLGITCNTTIARSYMVTAVTNNTSFVITSSAAPTLNPACISFTID